MDDCRRAAGCDSVGIDVTGTTVRFSLREARPCGTESQVIEWPAAGFFLNRSLRFAEAGLCVLRDVFSGSESCGSRKQLSRVAFLPHADSIASAHRRLTTIFVKVGLF